MTDNFRLVIHDQEFREFLEDVIDGRPLRAALMAGALYLKGVFSEYPNDSNAHRPQPFVSDAQRRGFFYHLHAGDIEVPYQRGSSPKSETMSKKWGISEQNDTIAIGNSASYAPLLVGRKQTAYHKATGWKDIETMYEENVDAMGDQVVAGFKQAIRKKG